MEDLLLLAIFYTQTMGTRQNKTFHLFYLLMGKHFYGRLQKQQSQDSRQAKFTDLNRLL
jgi:hypothetical protein